MNALEAAGLRRGRPAVVENFKPTYIDEEREREKENGRRPPLPQPLPAPPPSVSAGLQMRSPVAASTPAAAAVATVGKGAATGDGHLSNNGSLGNGAQAAGEDVRVLLFIFIVFASVALLCSMCLFWASTLFLSLCCTHFFEVLFCAECLFLVSCNCSILLTFHPTRNSTHLVICRMNICFHVFRCASKRPLPPCFLRRWSPGSSLSTRKAHCCGESLANVSR